MVHFPTRYWFLVVLLVIIAHLLFTFWQGDYYAASYRSLKNQWSSHTDTTDTTDPAYDPATLIPLPTLAPLPHDDHKPHADPHPPNPHVHPDTSPNPPPKIHPKPDTHTHKEDTRPRANATFVILVRNSELKEVAESLKQIEDRFNREYHYPYVFLNEEPFTDEFKRWTRELISAPAHYGLIPAEHWYQPPEIDERRASRMRQVLEDDDVIYGGSVSYRNMCRFNSGFFYRHPLMQQFRYYWRVEPGVKFFCDVSIDPFMYMQEHNKTYGFTISLYEFERTIPSLWAVTKEFIRRYPHYLPEGNAMEFLSDDGGLNYNLCHFWSNFEIADMTLWRSPAYTAYFDFLDSAGGFYYERWGDAPVHSIGAALFSTKDQIHFFKEIGYRHEPFQHCPQGEDHRIGKCWCEERDNFDYDGYSCTSRYDKMLAPPPPPRPDTLGRAPGGWA